ncbi:hypothetical protein ACH5RR_027891 [Cinchona calisaya]|uniref:Uncharacterized protein n=1 Tax=Cinchona calisaya TaxID=153742 RepID=A0ABD2YM62_9GENT
MLYYYVEPISNLGNTLRDLQTDENVRKFLQWVENYKVIEVYCDHRSRKEINEITSKDNGKKVKTRVIIKEIKEEPKNVVRKNPNRRKALRIVPWQPKIVRLHLNVSRNNEPSKDNEAHKSSGDCKETENYGRANYSLDLVEEQNVDSASNQAQNGDNVDGDGATIIEDEFARYSNYCNDDHFGYENENEEPPICHVVNEGPSQSFHKVHENCEQTTRTNDCQTQFGRAEKHLHGQQINCGQNMEENNIGQQQQEDSIILGAKRG